MFCLKTDLETILCSWGLNLESEDPTISETTPPTLWPMPTISGGIDESDDNNAAVVRKISAVLSFSRQSKNSHIRAIAKMNINERQ